MIYIIVVWFTLSGAALFSAALAAWRIRRFLKSGGMSYLLAMLIGAALYNSYAAYIGLAALSLPTINDKPSIGAIVFTAAHAVEVIPLILFTLYLLGIVGPDAPSRERIKGDVP